MEETMDIHQKKGLELAKIIMKNTNIPQDEALDLVMWTYYRKISQEVIEFIEKKLNRGEIVEEIDILDYINDLITAMEEQQNQY